MSNYLAKAIDPKSGEVVDVTMCDHGRDGYFVMFVDGHLEDEKYVDVLPSGCDCHRCIKDLKLTAGPDEDDYFESMPLSAIKMILCPTCGNKRCPKASDHRLKCTGSDDPGQAGSIYGGV